MMTILKVKISLFRTNPKRLLKTASGFSLATRAACKLRLYIMKNFRVEIIQQQHLVRNVVARNQPEAIRLAYQEQGVISERDKPEVVKIRAKERFD